MESFIEKIKRDGLPRAKNIGGLLVVIGVCLLLVAGIAYKSTAGFLETAKSSEGKIVELVMRGGSPSGTVKPRTITYAPKFEFKDHHGSVHRVISSWSSPDPEYREGDIVDVLYDPSSPQNARIDSWKATWGLSESLGLVGLVSVIFGLLIHRLAKKSKDNKTGLEQPVSPATSP